MASNKTTKVTVNKNLTAKRKTIAPSGVSIKRTGGVFAVTWKIADADYADGQSFQYRRKGEKSWFAWGSGSVGVKATSKSITYSANSFYPRTATRLTEVQARIRGKRKDFVTTTTKVSTTKKANDKIETTTITRTTTQSSMSDWTTKSYVLHAPPVPNLSAALSSTYANVTTFSWSMPSMGESQWFTDVEWQSCLLMESSIVDGKKIGWKASLRGYQHGTGTATGSASITEDTVLLANASYTRWFRVRARGPAGASDWRYAKHIYAKPYQARINSRSTTQNKAGGLNCHVTWTADHPIAHPIDYTTVQYALMTPAANLQPQSGATWTDALVSRDTPSYDKATFSVDDTIDLDQCLFVRVNTTHDGNTTYGIGTHVKSGPLKDPSGLSVVTNDSTFRATVTATNNSDVPDSYLAIVYKTKKTSIIVGVSPAGNGEHSVDVQCPDWSSETSYSFGVYAVVGPATYKAYGTNGARSYTITTRMRSTGTLWHGGEVPVAPTNVIAAPTTIPGTVTVTWDWSWRNANRAELSWADHEDAWESTDEPDKYEITNLSTARWNISGLATGQRWYIRVRLINAVGDDYTYGAYSETVTVDLASAPSIPVLVLSESVITQDDSVTASWVYSTTDGTLQAYAEICECELVNGEMVYGSYKLSDDLYASHDRDYYERSGTGTDADPYVYTQVSGIVYPSEGVRGDNPAAEGWYVWRDIIAHAETAQHITLTPAEAGWETGRTYNLAVRVTSASGSTSDDWSAPVAITVAEPLEVEITQTSLEHQTITVDGETYEAEVLTELPFTATITGAGANGITTLAIERAESYHIRRPDETVFDGHEGETVALMTQTGEAQITVTLGDLIASLDDGARYRLVATVQDSLGQSAKTSMDFEVHWEHQALMPEGECEFDEDALIARITLTEPTGADPTDSCDIYRLSTDKPELIVADAEFDTEYVDPYPAFGRTGGYRVVYKTAYGDYITEDNEIAWVDLGDEAETLLDPGQTIIDFDGGQIQLQYNMSISSKWDKDFQETQYLGGAVQGDWNPAVSRTTTINAVALTFDDQVAIQQMRRLAVSPSICHVRTSDGSSYAADVQVSEDYSHDTAGAVATFSLAVTRVDTEQLDGMTAAEWEDLHPEEEEGE